MSEYEIEPTPGLPGKLPAGERIIWQGSPDWRALARTAFHTRVIAGYFVLLSGAALASAVIGGGSDYTGVVMTGVLGILGVALLHLIAWGSARTTIYTLTNRRIVIRIGIAVPKCINLPLGMIASVDMAARPDGTGDLPLALGGNPKLGFLALWPHARPWRIVKPEPMLRSVPDATSVATLIAQACLAANPQGRVSAIEAPAQQTHSFAEAQAA